jgi:hypothetical protein
MQFLLYNMPDADGKVQASVTFGNRLRTYMQSVAQTMTRTLRQQKNSMR